MIVLAHLRTCCRCQGSGEIVTDWEHYINPRPDDIGDEAVTACPDCDGEGIINHLAETPTREAGSQ